MPLAGCHQIASKLRTRHTQACQCVDSVNVHGAAPTNALSATPSKGQSWVHLVLDANQGVQHHRTSLVQVEGVGLHARLAGGLIGVPSVDLECLDLAVRVLLGLRCGRRLSGGLDGGGHAAAEDLRREAPCCKSQSHDC